MRPLLFLAIAACGGHTEGHAELTAEAKAFHDVLSPLWHASASPDRTNNTCAAVGRMSSLAEAMTTAKVEHVQSGYVDKAKALVAATSELGKACGAPGRATFDESFHAVHEAFHAVVEQCHD